MALIAHYPLTRNGADHATSMYDLVASGSPTFVNGGKIGNCYKAGNTSTFFDTNIRPCDLGQYCSISFWIYIDQDGNKPENYSGGLIGCSTPIPDRPLNIYTYPQLSDLHVSIKGTNISESGFFGYRTWTHTILAFGKDGMSIYKNGVFHKNIPNMKVDYTNTSNIFLGKNDSGSRTEVKLNDIRFYNHCLSESEVKEVYKTKILHHKLDKPVGDNLAYGSELQVYNNNNVPATIEKTGAQFEGNPIYRLTMRVTEASLIPMQTRLHSHGVWTNTRFNFPANEKHLYQILYKPISHPNVRVGGTASNISGWIEQPPKPYKQGWYVVGQYRHDTVVKDDYIYTSFYDPTLQVNDEITIEFCGQCLVKGTTKSDYDMATPRPLHLLRDLSGFGHSAWGAVGYMPAFVKDEKCYEFDGIKQKVTITPDFIASGSVFSELTITGSWYIEENSAVVGVSSHNLFSISDNYFIRARLNPNNSLWVLICGSGGYEIYNTRAVCPEKRWFNLAITFKDGCMNIYIDGILRDTVATSTKSIHRLNDMNSWIGGFTGDVENWKGKIKEFAVYATELSQKDIEELHSNSIYFSKTSTQCNEIIENTPESMEGTKSVKIEVHAQGFVSSGEKSYYILNGNKVPCPNRGFTVVRFNNNLDYVERKAFDTYTDVSFATSMITYLNSLPFDDYILVFTYDEPSRYGADVISWLSRIGLHANKRTWDSRCSYIAMFNKTGQIYYEGFCPNASAGDVNTRRHPSMVHCTIELKKNHLELDNKRNIKAHKVVEYINDNSIETIDKYGHKWAKIFYHDNKSGTVLWNSWGEMSHCHGSTKYSRFGSLERFRNPKDGKFTFLLEYPGYDGYNMWRQSSHPMSNEEVIDYSPISISWSGNAWRGIAIGDGGGASAFLDCTDSTNWWFCIGSRVTYGTPAGMPGFNGTIVQKVALYVRVDEMEDVILSGHSASYIPQINEIR